MKLTNTQLQQIIKEEAIRLKTRMMLENEKTQIEKRLQQLEECDMMETQMEENSIMEEAFTEPEARQWLGTMAKSPVTVKQLQTNVNSALALAKAGTPPAWLAPAVQGKDLNDKNQFNAAFQAIYKMFSDAYVPYYIKNGKQPYQWDVNTNTFTPMKSSGTGLGFGMGTQHEGKEVKGDKI